MTITISTNISASIAQAAMTRNSRELDSAMEKLSTGKKINSAADNASGLAITTRMTTRMREILHDINYYSSVVNMMTIADGALVETEAMLQRMRELALQSGTGTTDSKDRSHLSREFEHLRTEIDRIARNTTYNEIALLSGDVYGYVSGEPEGRHSDMFAMEPVGRLGNSGQDGGGISTTFGNFTIDNNSDGNSGVLYANGRNPSQPSLSGIASKTLSAASIASGIAVASSVLTEVGLILGDVQHQRAKFGGMTNRLSYSIDNLINMHSRLEASRSQIMDADYARATSELAGNQILQQAGMAMIAQANALPETVMMLLSD